MKRDKGSKGEEMVNDKEVLHKLNKKWQQDCPKLAELQLCDWVPWSRRNSIHGISEVGIYILAKYESSGVSPVDPLDEHISYFGKSNIGRTTSIRTRLN